MSGLKGTKVVRSPDINPKIYGSIPGVPVLTTFAQRWECSNAGVHAPLRAGIHGGKKTPAYSVVLSGGYEDDCDNGEFFTYTGEGGRSTVNVCPQRVPKGCSIIDSRQSWSGPQSNDQEWVRGNKSLQLSQISGNPVRVVRGHKLPSRYAPTEGYRYDGVYKVIEATRAVGKTGFMTCQFLFERLPGQPPLPNEVLRPRKVTKPKPTPTRPKAQPVAGPSRLKDSKPIRPPTKRELRPDSDDELLPDVDGDELDEAEGTLTTSRYSAKRKRAESDGESEGEEDRTRSAKHKREPDDEELYRKLPI
ncbi:PUA-like domain-containing protein [Mycena vulgaris]|nr:PUA-like domain-containing protein [Mycena vulgaris]